MKQQCIKEKIHFNKEQNMADYEKGVAIKISSIVGYMKDMEI